MSYTPNGETVKNEIRSVIHRINECLNDDDDDTTDELVSESRKALENLVNDGDNIEFENYPDTDTLISNLETVEEGGSWEPRLLSDVRYALLELLDRQKTLHEGANRYFNNN